MARQRKHGPPREAPAVAAADATGVAGGSEAAGPASPPAPTLAVQATVAMQAAEASRPGPEPAAYANHFEVGFNAFEFLFDFAQDYDSPGGTATAHTRIVTAPAYAKVFKGLLDQSIGEYEASFGPIEQMATRTPGSDDPDAARERNSNGTGQRGGHER